MNTSGKKFPFSATGATRVAHSLAPLQEANAADPLAAEGLRLIRSFLLIDDSEARDAIIKLAEKIAEKGYFPDSGRDA